MGCRPGAALLHPRALLHPSARSNSGQLPRPASSSSAAASTVWYSPTSVAASASGKGGAPSYAPSASSWLTQDHPNHSAQLAQFVAASATLQRDGLIASPRHPDGASIAAALRQSQLPAVDASQPQAAPRHRQDPRLESCTHLSGIIVRSAGSVHPVTGRWQGAIVETGAGKVFINRGDRVFPHGRTQSLGSHDNMPEVPIGTTVEVLILDRRNRLSKNSNYAPRADRWWVEGESSLVKGASSIW